MLLRARWLLPIHAPPIRDGVICVHQGRVAEVRRHERGETIDLDLGDVALLPGFVNAHTHLELTAFQGKVNGGRRPQSLWDWIDGLLALLRQPHAGSALHDGAVAGANLSLAAGVTLVGDISRTGSAFRHIATTPLRAVCFHELISGARLPPASADELAAAIDAFDDWVNDGDSGPQPQRRLTAGVSPHSLYNVEWSDLRRSAALAQEREIPLTIHLAETADEIDWLHSRSGPLARFLKLFSARRSRTYASCGAVAALHHAGMMRLHPLLAHCNYLTDEEVAYLGRRRCHVAWCPRTHAWFGHAPHRWRELLAAGANVCIGTDSLASNSSLSVLDELRFARSIAPDMPARELLAMGTVRGALALGREDESGAIREGQWADFAAVACNTTADIDPEAAILDNPWPVMWTMIGGSPWSQSATDPVRAPPP